MKLLTKDDIEALAELEELIDIIFREGNKLDSAKTDVLRKIYEMHRDGREDDLRHGMRAIFPGVTYKQTKLYQNRRNLLLDVIKKLNEFSQAAEGVKRDKFRYTFCIPKKEKSKNKPIDLRIHFELSEPETSDSPGKGTANLKIDSLPTHQPKEQQEPVRVEGRLHRKYTYSPRLMRFVSSLLVWGIPLALFLSFGALFYAPSHLFFWGGIGLFWLLAFIVVWPGALALRKAPSERIVCFNFRSYFLRIILPHIVIVSYSGTCPKCGKKLDLVFDFFSSLHAKRSYYGMCESIPAHVIPASKITFQKLHGLLSGSEEEKGKL
jgi:hypothetical protein